MEINTVTAVTWFPRVPNMPFALIRVPEQAALGWHDGLASAFRRAYISDDRLAEMVDARSRPPREILNSRLPPAGPVMAGDFGEILVYLYQGSSFSPSNLHGQKKWRLKETRTHAAPYSDVVHFHLPSWPVASNQDALLCSEVKVKSTATDADPIADARRDIKKDRVSRLAKTLVWLQERAMTDMEIQVEQVERYIDATAHPVYEKRFQAVAVVDDDFVAAEIAKIVQPLDHDCDLVVIAVPALHATYSAVYEACASSV
ncbi:MAG: SAVED domain-containing protein [Polaromonas sp.]|nr:SAVED domain-containing protein [Polaromonas sp.]